MPALSRGGGGGGSNSHAMAMAAQGMQTVLDLKGATRGDLQTVRAQVEEGLQQERQHAEAYLRGQHQQQHGAPAMRDVEERLEALLALQAVLRAFLRRNQHTMAYLSSTASGGGSDGQEDGPTEAAREQDNEQGRAFRRQLAEAEALGWAYLSLGCLHSLEQATVGGPVDRGHAIGPVPFPLGRVEQAWDFELVREEVLAEVFGVGQQGQADEQQQQQQLGAGQQPLESWLGRWWANVLPIRGEMRLAEAPFLPWRVLGARLREGVGMEAAMAAARQARLLTLYAAADAWAAQQHAEGRGLLSVEALRQGLAVPFAAQVGVPMAEALACLALWSADQQGGGGGAGVDELALAANLPTTCNPGTYRRLLWALAAHHRFAEAAHLLDVAPPAHPTPLDGCLAVGVLLGLGQWQQAFVRQRLLSASPHGPLARLPVPERLSPLRLLAHRLVEARRVGWLTALPLNPLEAQHVVATLYQSPLRTRDHALLALLLRRREYPRAWAAWALLGPDVPDDRGDAQAAKEDLARLVQAVERFIPQEELGAMRRARDALVGGTGRAEDAALLERFANLAPVDEGEGVEEGAGQGASEAAMAWQRRRRVRMEGERAARAPLRSARSTGASQAAASPSLLGSSGFGSRGGMGGFAATAAALDSPMKRGAGEGFVGGGMGAESLGRRARGAGSGIGGGIGGGAGAGAAGRLRSPPMALRPGWSSRRDRFAGPSSSAAAGGGGGDGSRMEEEEERERLV